MGCWGVGVLGCWGAGVLGCRGVGVSGCWGVGVSGCWGVGVLGVLGCWGVGVLRWWGGGAAGWRRRCPNVPLPIRFLYLGQLRRRPPRLERAGEQRVHEAFEHFVVVLLRVTSVDGQLMPRVQVLPSSVLVHEPHRARQALLFGLIRALLVRHGVPAVPRSQQLDVLHPQDHLGEKSSRVKRWGQEVK